MAPSPSLTDRLLDKIRTGKAAVGAHDPLISRRAFMGAMGGVGGATLAGLVLPGHAAVPRLERFATGYRLQFGERDWVVDARAFGTRATIFGRERDGEIILLLRRAWLPGTSARFDMHARIYERDAKWRVALTIPALGLREDMRLDHWLARSAQAIVRHGAVIRAGDCTIATPNARGQLDANFALTLTATDTPFTLEGTYRCEAQGLRLSPSPPSDEALRAFRPGAELRHAASFELIEPRSCYNGVIGCGTRASHAAFRTDTLTALSGETLDEPSGKSRSVLLVEGAGALSVVGRGASKERQSIKMDRAALLVASKGGHRRDMTIAGTLKGAVLLDLGFGVATLASDQPEPVLMSFASGTPASARVPVRLAWIELPAFHGAQAVIDLSERPMEAQLLAGLQMGADRTLTLLSGFSEENTDEDRQAASDDASPRPATDDVVLPLDDVRIHLRRGADLFNLTFGLTSYSLRIRATGEAYLRRRRPSKRKAPWPPARLRVDIAPQHMAETITPVQDPSCSTPPAEEISRTRQSGPSRLVFDLGGGDMAPLWKDRPLTIEALTDWHELPMMVADRALAKLGTDLNEQLKAASIDQATPLGQAYDKIAQSLGPPSAEETALELHGRLIFSPSEAGRWLVPAASSGERLPIWNARLDGKGRTSVRAIWSSWLRPQSLEVLGPTHHPMLALSAANHVNIVGQTATYGLPALRRIVDRPKPGENAFRNVPRAGVVRPDATYHYLREAEAAIGPDEAGVAIAAPFDDADISLTSLGGIVVADWQGDPPILLPQLSGGQMRPHGIPETFDLQRLSIETWLGRDIRILAVRKGYLLPLGIRAAFIKLAERRFLNHPRFKFPVAYEVQRSFILVQRPTKQFAGINQPFGGRQFPPESIEILTRQSPDLVDPERGDAAEKRAAGRLIDPVLTDNDLVFWPRTTKLKTGDPRGPGDVDFAWAIDGHPSPAISNLLFVGNSVLGSLDAMAKVADFYRHEDVLRTARHAGAKRRYAATREEGRTSFETDSWQMNVTGRILPTTSQAEETESFLMDGRMAGADQPPFYPTVDQARIIVQSADRLLGRPLGYLTVGYTSNYVRNGFGGPNPGEIYLEVYTPGIKLSLGGQVDAVGGFARPDSFLAALSRKTGLVGGSDEKQLAAPARKGKTSVQTRSNDKLGPSHQSVAAPLPNGASLESPFNYSSAEAGKFDPTQFFGKNATLLGIIDLGAVVREVAGDLGRAPQLVETLAFGALGQGSQAEVLARIHEVAARLQGDLDSAIVAVDNALEKTQLTLPDGTIIPFSELYPDLNQRYKEARAVLYTGASGASAIQAIREAATLGAVAVAAGRIVTNVKPLLPAIERVAKDPIPELVQEKVDQLASAWDKLGKLIDGGYRAYGEALFEAIASQLLHNFCATIDRDGLSRILLGLNDDVRCEQLLTNPADVLGDTAQALFETHFALPLRRLLTLGKDLEAEVEAKIAFARAALEREIVARLIYALGKIGSRIDQASSILRQDVQRDLARALSARLDARVQATIAQGGSVFEILDRLNGLAGTFGPEVMAEVAGWRSEIIATPQEIDAVMADLATIMVATIVQSAEASLRAEVARIRSLAVAQLERKRDEIIAYLAHLADTIIDGLIASAGFANIARLGAAASAWCGGTLPQAFKAAKALASDVLVDQAVIAQQIVQLSDALRDIKIPQGTPPAQAAMVEKYRNRALARTSELADLVHRIGALRDVLGKLEADASARCDALNEFLAPLTNLMAIRNQAVGKLAQAIGDMDGLVDAMKAASIPTASIAAGLAQRTGRIISGVTSIANVAARASAGWQKILQARDVLRASLGQAATAYLDEIESALQGVQDEADDLARQLRNVQSPEALVALGERLASYAKADKALAAIILRASSMAGDSAALILRGAAGAMSSIGGLLYDVHKPAFDGLSKLLEILDTDIVRLLINKQVLDDLLVAKQALQEDCAALFALSEAGEDAFVALDAARKVQLRWREAPPPALVKVVGVLLGFIDNFLKGNLGAILNTDLRPALQELEKIGRELIEQFVPTGLNLDYDFSAALKKFPESDPRFFMTEGERPDNLVLKSLVKIDFITGKREVSVTGKLQPFTIRLLGKSLPMADIQFGPSSFESINGSKPKFETSVSAVVLGEYLEFIQPLQAWLAPGGEDSGFYIKPIIGAKCGIKAGYIYDAGVIQIGNLQFINVSFGVSASLYFDGSQAEYGFNLASAARPFLIAAPPYGGGGYLSLVANAQGILQIELSFVFGAVVAIKFGPMNGQGRVVTGFRLVENGGGSRIIEALVEAVGEGNIACFSICISLQVRLRQVYDDGVSRLEGDAQYSFKFKVGFVTFRYAVTAFYSQKGNKSQGRSAGRAASAGSTVALAAPSGEACPEPPPGAAPLRNHVPPKASAWRDYRRHLAIDLL